MENDSYTQQNQNRPEFFQESSAQNTNLTANPTAGMEPLAASPKPKSKRSIIVIAIVSACIVLLVAIILGVILLSSGGDPQDGEEVDDESIVSGLDDSSSSKEKLKRLGFIRSYDWESLHDFIGIENITYDGMQLPLTGEKVLARYEPDKFQFWIKEPGKTSKHAEYGNTIDDLSNYKNVVSITLYRSKDKTGTGYDETVQDISFGQTSTMSDFQSGNFLISDSIKSGGSIRYFGVSSEERSRLDNHNTSEETGYYDDAIDMHLILQKLGKPTGFIIKTGAPNLIPGLYWISNDYVIGIFYDDIVTSDDGYIGFHITDVNVGPKDLIMKDVEYDFEYMSFDDYLKQYPDPKKL